MVEDGLDDSGGDFADPNDGDELDIEELGESTMMLDRQNYYYLDGADVMDTPKLNLFHYHSISNVVFDHLRD